MILHTEEKTKIESDGRVSLSKGPICDSGVENDSHHSYLQHLDASAHAEARIAGVIQVVGFGDAAMWLEVGFFNVLVNFFLEVPWQPLASRGRASHLHWFVAGDPSCER